MPLDIPQPSPVWQPAGVVFVGAFGLLSMPVSMLTIQSEVKPTRSIAGVLSCPFNEDDIRELPAFMYSTGLV